MVCVGQQRVGCGRVTENTNGISVLATSGTSKHDTEGCNVALVRSRISEASQSATKTIQLLVL